MNSRSLFLVLLLAIALLVGACSDEPYGSLYCPPGPRDTLVVYPRLELQKVKVAFDGHGSYQEYGMAGMQSLYLGTEGDTQSEILVNFRFDKWYRYNNYSYPDSLFDEAHIKQVWLSLNRLRPYMINTGADSNSVSPPGIAFVVQEVVYPFYPDEYQDWPGPAASLEGRILNTDFTEVSFNKNPRIHLEVEDFLAWVEEWSTVGMVISAGQESEPGLVGFASKELRDLSEVGPLDVGDMFAPTIGVEFNDGAIPNLLIPPEDDSSTFHQVAALPPEQVQVQSGLQSYSVLTFDIPPISEGSCVTQLGIRMSSIETSLVWNGDCLVMSYLDPARVDRSEGFIEDYRLWSYDMRMLVCPEAGADSGFLGFGPETGLVGQLPDELNLISYFDEMNYKWPKRSQEIYFSQSTFHGPTASVDLRPALMIITGPKGD